ncbi:unnamed protein product, partial [Penicillium olsonii]
LTPKLLCHGAMILDQLGMFDDIYEMVEPVKEIHSWRAGGVSLTKLETPKLLQARYGYPCVWLERQQLLGVMFKHLREKEKVLAKKKFLRAEHSARGVIAHCSDGTSFNGSIIVGADGVHSPVRQDMWQHMKDAGLGPALKRDLIATMFQYSCVYGVSAPTVGIEPGIVHRLFGKDFTFFSVVGKERIVYWFLITKLEKTHRAPDVPKLNRDNIEDHIRPYLTQKVNDRVHFQDVYRNTTSTYHVPIEEGTFEYWTWNRFACVGDAINQTTPNLAQGLNGAIENAVSLSNCIASMLKAEDPVNLSTANIDWYLSTWASSRKPRAHAACLASSIMTRFEALLSWRHQFIVFHILPHFKDSMGDLAGYFMAGSDRLDFLPLPDRSLKGTTPFKDSDRKVCVYHREQGTKSRAPELNATTFVWHLLANAFM